MRRSILPPRATRRQLVVPARHITTKPATIANIVYDLLQRRAKKYWQDLTPRNSDLLACSLNDFLPWEAKTPFPPPEPDARRTHPDPQDLLLWGHHLVYFAPCPATTSLLPDGTDADHSPGPPFTRRLWAGGSLIFNVDPGPVLSKPDHVPRPEPIDNADAGVLPRGVCIEEIEDVRVAGVPPGVDAWTGGAPGAGEKVFVDLIRKYGWVRDGGGTGRLTDNEAVSQEVRTDLGQRGPSIVERRTLCFMAPKTVDEARRDVESPHRRAVKGEFVSSALCLAFPCSRPPPTNTSLLAQLPFLLQHLPTSQHTASASPPRGPCSSVSARSRSTPTPSTSTASTAARSRGTETCSFTGPCS